MHINRRKLEFIYLYLVLLVTGCVSTEPDRLRGCYSINDFYSSDTDGAAEGFNIQLEESTSWIGNYKFSDGPDGKYVKFWFERNHVTESDSDRARVQLNMYSLADVKDFYINTSFSLDPSLSNYMEEGDAFEWLNLFELWLEPGWSDTLYPAKVHLRIVKNSDDNHFSPVISAQYKDSTDNKWYSLWEKNINFRVFPSETYHFKLYLSVSPVQTINATISDTISEHIASIVIEDKFTHPDYRGIDTVYWGVNPIKLYTGESLLNRLDENDASLAIIYSDFDFCAL